MKTGWYNGKIFKPFRVGVYQTKNGKHFGYQYWDGVSWGSFNETPDIAYRFRWQKVSDQYANDDWQGLVKN